VLNKTPPFQKDPVKTAEFLTLAPATVDRDRQLLGQISSLQL
jgi:hypothetical protein